MITLQNWNGKFIVTDTQTRAELYAGKSRAKALETARTEAKELGLEEDSEALWA